MTQARMLNFGKRLTLQQYEECVVSLHTGLSPAQQLAREREIRRKELDLMVDFHLGTAFPSERRNALWEVHQRLDERRMLNLVRGLVRYPTNPMKGIAKAQVRALSRVLDRAELAALLDLSEDELAELL